jgi:hypothetical protein
MRNIVPVLVLLAPLLACVSPEETSLAQRAASAPPPDGAGFIQNVAYAGTGCPGNSATSGISPDKQVVTSIFSAFVAEKGGASDPAKATLDCLVMLDIEVPAGWQYTLESVDYRGFAGLQSEVTASRRSLYLISGSPLHVTPPARFKGATDKDYNHSDVSATAPAPWSPCGGGQVLWVATEIAVQTPRSSRSGQLTVDTIDTELTWRRCQ